MEQFEVLSIWISPDPSTRLSCYRELFLLSKNKSQLLPERQKYICISPLQLWKFLYNGYYDSPKRPKDLYLCNTLGPVVRKPIEGDLSLVFGTQSNMTLGSKAPYTTSVTWISAVKAWERGYCNPRLKVNRTFFSRSLKISFKANFKLMVKKGQVKTEKKKFLEESLLIVNKIVSKG